MISKEWVIIATERARRPQEFQQLQKERPPLPSHLESCPFCRGNEEQTPPALLLFPEESPWQVRVVPNKFAALSPDTPCGQFPKGQFIGIHGYGAAEVVIETPRHDLSPAQMPPEEVSLIMEAYRRRYRALEADSRNSLITLFRNHGPRAGTSLQHPHSQIIATPVVPPHVRNQIVQALRSYDTFGSCVFCFMLAEEQKQEERLVQVSDHFLAFCPYASRVPFEIQIFPRRHSSSFGEITPDEKEDLARVLHLALGKIYHGLNNPDYNLIVRSYPLESKDNRHYHWHLVIVPRLTTPAGFEIGTGIYINTARPEESAAFLRLTEPGPT
jgi:UDPglucose--hexose-1-phosphate uridylyltransferase